MPAQKVKSKPAETEADAAFRKYAPELHRYLARRIRQPSSAPDLTQEIFERFIQLGSTSHVRNVQSYLYRIASNLVQEFCEREGRSLVAFDSELVEAAAHNVKYGIEDAAERLALEEDLNRALAQLSPMHRAVLLLIKREGLSYEEVAKHTGLTCGTVAQYMFEARAKMKNLLKGR